MNANVGWQCPVCKRVWSPYQAECVACRQKADKVRSGKLGTDGAVSLTPDPKLLNNRWE